MWSELVLLSFKNKIKVASDINLCLKWEDQFINENLIHNMH